MTSLHPTYRRIVANGFAEGPVPEDVYRDVMGQNGAALVRARSYEQQIMALVTELAHFAVGKTLLNRLNESSYPSDVGVLVSPSTASQAVTDDLHSMRPVQPENAYAKSSPIPGARNAYSSGPAKKGTGRGSSAKIVFNPGVASSCGFIGGTREVLFHELTHALRAMSGAMVFRPMPHYDWFEEFVAITLTNMLLSEQHVPLRDGHNCQAMGRSLEQFCKDYDRFLKVMQADTQNARMYKLLGALPESTVAWNPLRGW